MDIIKCFRSYCAVVECGSFSIAADKLLITQPSVSTHIHELEKYYNTVLLDRGREKVLPTDTGKLLYSYAKEVLHRIKKIENAMNDARNLLSGNVEIGASTVPGTYILPEVLKRFKEQYPKINISLKIRDTSIIIKEVFEKKVDFGVVGERTRKQGLVFCRLTDDTVCLIAPGSERREKITIEELKKMPLIFRESSSGTRMTVAETLKKKGIRVKDLNIVMELGSTEAVKQGVIEGLGISFVSERTIRNEEKQGLLRRIDVERLNIKRNFWLVKRANGNLTRVAKTLLNFLKKECCIRDVNSGL